MLIHIHPKTAEEISSYLDWVEDIKKDCIKWRGAVSGSGYGQKSIGGKLYKVHRLAWEEVYGPILDGLCVLHYCDNKICINTEHLFLGTYADNAEDKFIKGRYPGKVHNRHGERPRIYTCDCEMCSAVFKRKRRREVEHGTLSGSTYFKCRCAKCKKAFADWSRAQYYKRQGRAVPDRKRPYRPRKQ